MEHQKLSGGILDWPYEASTLWCRLRFSGSARFLAHAHGERKHKASLDIGQHKGGKVHCNTLLSPMRQQLCMNSRHKPEMDVCYTSDMLIFFKEFPKLNFKISVEIW